ncbi:MAG: DUF1330 domain-containing protein [Parvularculaceae bacterium]|nr:DUF1330 domain-containing protein [Parvularculaceae bacterium]
MSKPVYSFAYIQVKDHADYLERYGQHVLPVIEKFGGEFLAATPVAGVVEGDVKGNWAVLAKFPSAEQATAFYQSEEYAPLLKLRRETLTEGSIMVSFAEDLPA